MSDNSEFNFTLRSLQDEIDNYDEVKEYYADSGFPILNASHVFEIGKAIEDLTEEESRGFNGYINFTNHVEEMMGKALDSINWEF